MLMRHETMILGTITFFVVLGFLFCMYYFFGSDTNKKG